MNWEERIKYILVPAPGIPLRNSSADALGERWGDTNSFDFRSYINKFTFVKIARKYLKYMRTLYCFTAVKVLLTLTFCWNYFAFLLNQQKIIHFVYKVLLYIFIFRPCSLPMYTVLSVLRILWKVFLIRKNNISGAKISRYLLHYREAWQHISYSITITVTQRTKPIRVY